MLWLPSVKTPDNLPTAPCEGACCYIESENEAWIFVQGGWAVFTSSKPQPIPGMLLVSEIGRDVPYDQPEAPGIMPAKRKIEP